MYKCDFCCKYFSIDSFVFLIISLMKVFVLNFLLNMYSYEKCVRLSSSCTDFSECLTVNLVKNTF